MQEYAQQKCGAQRQLFFCILAVEPFDGSNLLLGQWLLLNK